MSSNPNSPISVNSRRRVEAERAAVKIKQQKLINKQQDAIRRQKEFTQKTQVWNEQILPRWGDLCHSSRVKDLCLKGIPPNIRGKVWPLLVGNSLQIDEIAFEELNARVQKFQEAHPEKTRSRRGSSIGRYDTFDKSTQEAEQKLEEERQQSYNCTRDTFIMPFSEAEALIEAVRSASNPNIDSKDCEDSQAAEFCRLTSTDNSTIQSTVPFDANNQKGSGIALQPNQNASLKQLSRDPLYDDPWAAMESVLGSSTAIEKKKSDFGSGRQISTSAETAHDVAGLTFIKRKSILWLKDISSVGNLNKSKNKEDADIDNFADITEELWFENERNGSLDQSALEDIQKQLFGVAGARHLHDSDDADKESCTLNAETTSDKNALTRIFPDVLDDSTSPDKTSNLDNRHDQDNLGSLSLTLPLEGPVNISSAECNFSPKRGHRAYSSLENSPAHRQQHSPNFLLKAGLLVEDEGGYQLAKEDEYKDVKGSLINDNIQLEPRTLPTNPSSAIRKAAIKNNFFTGSVSDMQQNSMDPIGIGYEDYLARLPNNENEIRKDKERSDSQFSVDGVPKSRTQSHSSVMSISKHSLGRSRDDSFSSTQAGRVLEQILISDDNYFNSVAASNAVEDNDQDVVESQNEYRSVSDTTCGESQSENGVQPNFISPSSYPNSSAIEEEYRKELERWEEFKNASLMNTISLIEWDLPRTFPTLGFFHDGGPMQQSLERVLLCFACYRPDIGYVQGMSFIVAMLLLYMDEFQAFVCFANLIGRRINVDFYRLKKDAIDCYVSCFNHFFKKFLPLLFHHLTSEGVTSEMFLMDWNLALFTKAMPLEVAAQVWDMYLLEGEIFIMSTALAILKMFAPTLSTLSVEQISPFLLHLPPTIKADELFANVAQIQISKKSYEKVKKKMYKNHQSYVPFESPSTKFGMRSRVLSDSKVIQSEAKNYFLSSNKSKNSTSRGINGTIQNSNSNITTSGRTSTYNGSNNRDDSQGTDSERHRSTETNGSVSKYNYSQLVDYPRRRLFDEEINAHHIKISNPLKSDGESEGDNKLDESHTLSDSKRRPSLSRGMRRFGALFVMGIGLNSSSASRKTLGSDSDEVHR